MSRIRTIKPETFTSETIAALSFAARWTFVGLWTYVDDEGRAKDNARAIRGALWPNDEERISSTDVDDHLRELEKGDEPFVCRYAIGGARYLHVINFKKHQKVNRPSQSKLPGCPKHDGSGPRGDSESSHGILTEDSVTPPGPDLSTRLVDQGERDSRSPRAHLTEPSTPRAHAQGGEGGHGSGSGSWNGEGNARDDASEDRHLAVVPDPAADKPPHASPRGLTEIPDDFAPSESMRRWANKTYPGLDLDEITRQFVRHWRSEGRRKKSWPDAWQKWVADEYTKFGAHSRHKKAAGQTERRTSRDPRIANAPDYSNTRWPKRN